MAVETHDLDVTGRSSALNDPRVRAILYQVAIVAGVVGLGWYLVDNTVTNLENQQIASGFGFLEREAGFEISEGPIEYSAADSYGRALFVGFLNTVKVAVLGVVLATILGTLVGVARLSSNWLVAKLASVYVEGLRNIPLLLQLFFWYAVITISLPGPRQALNPITGIFLSNRGLMFPIPESHPVFPAMGIALIVAIIGVVFLDRWAVRRQALTGQQFPMFSVGAGIIVGLPILVWLFGGAPTAMDVPALRGFNFRGGLVLTPEFAALLFGLTLYTASFIAEIVRGGILAVPHGQTEASEALGLRRSWTLRLIVLPQALRIIIPPTTSQYLNLTKNSSLAIAIGYPDLVAVGNTTINQTGQAVEAISIFMAVYLILSLLISVFMNWYNKKIALVER